MIYQVNPAAAVLRILGRTEEHPPWRHNGRRMTYHQLVLILSGACSCQIESRRYDALPGTLLFLPGGRYYRLHTDTRCEYAFACFTAPLSESDPHTASAWAARTWATDQPEFFLPPVEDRSVFLAEHSVPTGDAFAHLSTLFARCQQLYATRCWPDRLMIDALFSELLLWASVRADGDGRLPLSLKRITDYIASDYTARITPRTLADRFDLSRERVCALFRTHLDCAVSAYVNRVKLNHAVELLSNSSMNVSQIADYLGFSSVYYFSRLFKAQYGISPTGYRR